MHWSLYCSIKVFPDLCVPERIQTLQEGDEGDGEGGGWNGLRDGMEGRRESGGRRRRRKGE